MKFVRSNNARLKYQRFATLNSKDIEIINSEFVAKTQFLCPNDSGIGPKGYYIDYESQT